VDGTAVRAGDAVAVGAEARFAALVERVEPPVRRALVAAYGADAGREATADALAWAWEHLGRVEQMANPAGYLFRVGQTSARRGRRWTGRRSPHPVPERSDAVAAGIEPTLERALAALSPQQRAAVLLVHGWGHPLVEAAAAMGCGVPTVRNHVARGLAKLRAELGEDTDA
jgi:DNA-directed RNA polymerase specialized sigma24 family protein